MTYTTLIQPAELAALQRAGTPLVIFDCSFDLTDVAAGRRAYEAGHIPGALFLDLETDMSTAKTGRNGRHPLPSRETFAARLAELGVDDDTQVVGYDNLAGMYGARLWWMLRWAGHRAAAVLDGGIAAWRGEGLPVSADPVAPRAPGSFSLRTPLVSAVDYEEVKRNLTTAERLVIDARAADRFRGENETLDPIGGHIPQARNRFFKDNLDANGRFKPAAQLRAEFDAVRGDRPASQLISQCGSGVTACHNLLALEVAGLEGAALYPGSWSEWSAQPGAQVAMGAA